MVGIDNLLFISVTNRVRYMWRLSTCQRLAGTTCIWRQLDVNVDSSDKSHHLALLLSLDCGISTESLAGLACFEALETVLRGQCDFASWPHVAHS